MLLSPVSSELLRGATWKDAPSKLKETAYLSLCRSVLEYAAFIWDPFLSKNKNTIELVQHRAARFVCGDYKTTSSVTSMFAWLGWENLQDRRRELRLALLYKIAKGHVAVSADDIHLEKADKRTHANHPHKFKTKGASTKELKNFSTHRSIPEWNSLPASVAEASMPKTFKVQLAGLGTRPP